MPVVLICCSVLHKVDDRFSSRLQGLDLAAPMKPFSLL